MLSTKHSMQDVIRLSINTKKKKRGTMDQEERKKEKKKDIKEEIFIKHVPFKTM